MKTSDPGATRSGFRYPAAGAILLLLAAVILYLTFGRSPARPNVILISIDSLRPDHLGCYGYGRDTSPVLDKLAREGVLFETAVSTSSWTLPAHAALFTSLPDRVHGCFDDHRWLSDRSRFTVAEAFKKAGYETAGFFSGPYLHSGFGFGQGFDMYRDCTSFSEKTMNMLRGGGDSFNWNALSHKDITNPIVLEEVTAWIEKNRDGPFFAFIHLWDVHYDYIPPPPYDKMFDGDYTGPVNGRKIHAVHKKPEDWTPRDVEHLEALYDGEIRWTDHTLGKILQALECRGYMKDTIIAVTADHGEAFYEHGHHGHRHTLYEEEIRIPLVIHHPRSIPAGLRIQHPVQITDIAPTLLHLAGVSPMPSALGRSLVPLVRDPTIPWPATEAVCELIHTASGVEFFAMRRPDWKLIINFPTGLIAVFDLDEDPGEKAPLSEEDYPMSAEAFKNLYGKTARHLQQVLDSLPTIGERDTPAFSKMTKAQLRSLGYLK